MMKTLTKKEMEKMKKAAAIVLFSLSLIFIVPSLANAMDVQLGDQIYSSNLPQFNPNEMTFF
ncbi:hypothetical protein MFLO_13263 [Listeria floridensis FSL S10-1187]|uniref:Uncharacterized protein n=1 Tax=Listeria floridensis FSL S10-1187 TaxID=1265817 RepID=A0ABP3AV90_9LIST|nr:hypothetical protein MFLO_13263 [Listeria floridensis FSL S10-1187]